MPEPLHAVAYVSRSRLSGDIGAVLGDLVDRASRRNAASGLTGALICSPHYFAQVIEGPLDALEETFERIQLDRRHHDVAVLYTMPIAERSFPTWGMASAGVTEDESDIRRALALVRSEALAADPDEAGRAAMALLVRMLRERELTPPRTG